MLNKQTNVIGPLRCAEVLGQGKNCADCLKTHVYCVWVLQVSNWRKSRWDCAVLELTSKSALKHAILKCAKDDTLNKLCYQKHPFQRICCQLERGKASNHEEVVSNTKNGFNNALSAIRMFTECVLKFIDGESFFSASDQNNTWKKVEEPTLKEAWWRFHLPIKHCRWIRSAGLTQENTTTENTDGY